MGLLINIDNGGTFTDVCIMDQEHVVRAKTLTTPYDLTKCFIEVLKAGAKEKYGTENIKALLNDTDYIRYSTTAGTNAIVEKKGPRLGLILLKGSDVNSLLQGLEEKELFQVLVANRVGYIDPTSSIVELEGDIVKVVNHLLSEGANRLVVSLGGEKLLENEKILKKLMLNKYPRHLLGAVPILFSHELVEDRLDNNRTWTALINSFLHPKMESFLYNAENYLRNQRTKNPMLIFHNDGNSARVAKTTAIKSYGSGPRGGMEGAKALAVQYQIPCFVTMDIGGTTTDIGLVQSHAIKEKIQGEVEGIPTSFSISDLISVGAAGSSIIKVENGKVKVGPESVGAAPGPACFARGGQEATITDAYLLMGILDGESYFNESLKLDKERAEAVIKEKIASPLGVSLKEALLAMEKAYITKVAEGLSIYKNQTENATLLAFGGAGPLSACGAATAAGMNQIVIPRYAAIFSAFGLSFSDIAHEYQANVTELTPDAIEKQLEKLREKATRDMFAEGFDLSECDTDVIVRYQLNGEYVFEPVNNISLSGLKNGEDIQLHLKVVKPIKHFRFEAKGDLPKYELSLHRYQTIVANGVQQIPVYQFSNMQPGMEGAGPAIIEDELSTCRVEEDWRFRINENKDIFLWNERGQSK
jgi:N-methylhydantoinase A